MARAQELAVFGMQPFPHGLKLFTGDVAPQPKQLCAAPLPLALYAAVFIVVVAVFKMPLRVSGAASHRPNRQHTPTVTLFEIRMQ